MKTMLRLAALLLSIGTISELRAATLLGDVISGSYDFPCVGCKVGDPGIANFPNPFVVDGSIETILFFGDPFIAPDYRAWFVKFDGNSLTLTVAPAGSTNAFFNIDPFNGPVFTVLSGNTFGSVTNVVENLPKCFPCNPVTAFVLGDSVYVNWAGAGGHDVGDSITITFSVGNPVAAVPEPVTWAMMLIGFAGLGFVAYRRTKNKTAGLAGRLI
jgi:hypothetical protein